MTLVGKRVTFDLDSPKRFTGKECYVLDVHTSNGDFLVGTVIQPKWLAGDNMTFTLEQVQDFRVSVSSVGAKALDQMYANAGM